MAPKLFLCKIINFLGYNNLTSLRAETDVLACGTLGLQ
jgi:hypothetical protein